MVMMNRRGMTAMMVSGECRAGKNQHQQGGGKKLFHAVHCSTE